MKPLYIKIAITIIIIILIIFAYIKYGNLLFDQTHRVDQEVEHSMHGVTTISIKDISTDIVIHTSDQDDFYAVYKGEIKATTPKAIPLLRAKQKDNLLSIEISYGDYEILSMENMTFDIYLPSAYIDDLEVLTKQGNINLSPITLNSLSCVTLEGDIKIKASTLNSLLASSISGDLNITLTQDRTMPVTIDTDSGDIISEYKSIKETPYKLITTSGDIILQHN